MGAHGGRRRQAVPSPAGASPGGDAIAVARIAAIQAAKRTAELIPLCHPLPLDHVAAGALAIYDMVKGEAGPAPVIERIHLVEKRVAGQLRSLA